MSDKWKDMVIRRGFIAVAIVSGLGCMHRRRQLPQAAAEGQRPLPGRHVRR